MAKITITVEDVEGGLISIEAKQEGDESDSPAILVATAIIESINETSELACQPVSHLKQSLLLGAFLCLCLIQYNG